MEEDVLEIDLKGLLGALRAKAWLLLLITVLGGALALGGTFFCVTPKYRASVLMYVNSSSVSLAGTKLSISQGELSAAQSLIETYSVILNTRSTLNDVIERAGLACGYQELADMIEAESVRSTEVFRVDVVHEDPAEAARIANTIAVVLPEKIASIVEGSSARIVDMALTPRYPDSPNLILAAVLGAFLGLAASAGSVAARELRNDRVRSTDDLTRGSELPVLAVIPTLAQETGKDLNFAAAEAYKLLRTNLNFSLSGLEGSPVIGITSALRGEGKSTTAVNLACTMAQTGKQVVLVEADLRRPVIAGRLGLEPGPGLSNLLAKQCGGREALRESGLLRSLWVIPAGEIPPNPAELLGSGQMTALLAALRQRFDVVLVDLPPVGVVSDALALVPELGGMLLVTRQRVCTRSGLKDALKQLKFSGCRLLGFVMTGADDSGQKYGDYERERP